LAGAGKKVEETKCSSSDAWSSHNCFLKKEINSFFELTSLY
jgi:hypothetical protein